MGAPIDCLIPILHESPGAFSGMRWVEFELNGLQHKRLVSPHVFIEHGGTQHTDACYEKRSELTEGSVVVYFQAHPDEDQRCVFEAKMSDILVRAGWARGGASEKSSRGDAVPTFTVCSPKYLREQAGISIEKMVKLSGLTELGINDVEQPASGLPRSHMLCSYLEALGYQLELVAHRGDQHFTLVPFAKDPTV